MRWEPNRLHAGAEINALTLRQSHSLSAQISYQLSVSVFTQRLTASSIRQKVLSAHGLDRCPLRPLDKICWHP